MKKGLSPLIASVLLIAITVGVSAILINWMTSYTKGQTSKISEQSTTECAYKNIDFVTDPVTSSSSITLKLENTGTSAVNSTTQYIALNNGTTYTCNKAINLGVGEISTISISNTDCGTSALPTSWTSGDIVKIVYASPCQSFFSSWTSS